MNLDNLPVILGAGISGVLMSLALSRAGVRHVLIGGPEPKACPRLGESLNEVAGPELWRLFGRDHRDCFYPKAHISIFDGAVATQAYIADPNRTLTSVARYACGPADFYRPIPSDTIFHLDRARFDPALYRAARAASECVFVEGRVRAVEIVLDRAARVVLDDGTSFAPRYVFDTLGMGSPVAAAAGVDLTTLGPKRRVVWGHFRRAEGPCEKRFWLHGTNLLRLDPHHDGVDGIAWLIPLGTALSVGVSVDVDGDASALSAPALMAKLEAAYARRGLRLREVYPDPQPVEELATTHFIRDRAHGANWLLTGPSFAQIWYPASSGLWTTTAAAGLAAELLRDPTGETAAFYEKIMRPLTRMHEHVDQLARGPLFTSAADGDAFWMRWFSFVPARIGAYIRIAKGDLASPRLDVAALQALGALHARAPRAAQIMGGASFVSSKRVEDLASQADAFDGYFQPLAFRAKSWLRGIPSALSASP